VSSNRTFDSIEREILEARAARVRSTAKGETETSLVHVAEFSLRDDRYAVPFSQLRAAVPLRLVRAVPLGPSHVVGIVRHEGQILTAFSFAALVGVRGWRHDPATLLIIERARGGTCAIDCESIPRPITLPADLVERSRSAASDEAIIEILEPDRRILHLVDLATLIERAAALGGET
jgi:chemotaxis signal transduction protein